MKIRRYFRGNFLSEFEFSREKFQNLAKKKQKINQFFKKIIKVLFLSQSLI